MHLMYTSWVAALIWVILTTTQDFFKRLMLKFCHNKPVKVSVDGQMNTFSDQWNVLLCFMVTVMLPQPQFPGLEFIEATI